MEHRNQNIDIERTDELLYLAKKKSSRKKLIAIIVIAAVAAAGAGVAVGFNVHKDYQIESHMKIAQASLKEGDYEQAVKEFDKVIELTPAEADPYEGKGDAYRGMGRNKEALTEYRNAVDRDKKNKKRYVKAIQTATAVNDNKAVDELINEMHENVEGTENLTAERFIMGGDNGNLINEGLSVSDGDKIFVANKGENGTVTMIDDNDNEKILVKELKDEEDDVIISGLNILDDYLYFIANVKIDEIVLHTYNNYKGKSIYRVKTDGSEEPERILTENWDAKSYGGEMDYFAAGKMPDILMPQLMIVGNRIIFGERLNNDEGWEVSKVSCVGPEGKNRKEITKVTAETFTTDGKYIYAADNNVKIERIDIENGNKVTLVDYSDREQLNLIGNREKQLVYKNGKLYFAGTLEIGDGIFSFDLKTNEIEKICNGFFSADDHDGGEGSEVPTTIINISDDKLYFTRKTARILPEDSEFKCTLACVDLDSGNVNNIGTISHDFADEEFTKTGQDYISYRRAITKDNPMHPVRI